MIEQFLPRVTRPHASAAYGWVEIEYEYKPMGRALVDAGLVASCREYAVRKDWGRDPFACMSRKLRAIAMGWGIDVDDSGAHPTAKQAIVPVGRESGATFLRNRDQIMKAQGRWLFPGVSEKEARDRVKALYNSLNMDGTYDAWAERWGISESMPLTCLNVAHLEHGGGTFQFGRYLRDLAHGTEWLKQTLERQTGMHSFVQRWQATHKPGYHHAERTCKSFCFSEAESFSREAKAEWCSANGHACTNLQHDGVIIALRDGTDRDEAVRQLRCASEAALGYEQPCEIKTPEPPDGTIVPAPRSLEELSLALGAPLAAMAAVAEAASEGAGEGAGEDVGGDGADGAGEGEGSAPPYPLPDHELAERLRSDGRDAMWLLSDGRVTDALHARLHASGLTTVERLFRALPRTCGL
jgi:hypothetical protein